MWLQHEMSWWERETKVLALAWLPSTNMRIIPSMAVTASGLLDMHAPPRTHAHTHEAQLVQVAFDKAAASSQMGQ